MPVRATKRGASRSPFLPGADADVLICGASFAGLAVARELRASGARVLVLDRYEIGERQTSACAAPTEWLRNMGVAASIRQTFGSLLVHTPRVARARWRLPFTFSTFDYPELCEGLWEQSGPAVFDTAKVEGRTGSIVHTDRGDVSAPLIVDALGWRRVLGAGENVQPPDAALSRGLEVHPAGAGSELELWIDPRYVDAGYGWSFPARDELRIGVGSFDPRDPVKQPTLRLVEDVAASPDGYQGNWIPHRLRDAVEDGVFFAGDSAGHCLPLTAEGIRTAFYFGIACGRELRGILEGRSSPQAAQARYGAFSDSHRWKFEAMYAAQQSIRHLHGRPLDTLARVFARGRVSEWAFARYLDIAPPAFAVPAPPAARSVAAVAA
jgi:digeranylgeranylglycerophospholipid reductase